MKGSTYSRCGKAFYSILAAGALVSLAAVFQGQAQVILTDGNSTAQLDPTSQLGMYSWTVQNTPSTFQNQLNKQWFWYRVGTSGPEASIDTISAPVITDLTASTVTTTYYDSLSRFNVGVKYSLVGGSADSGTADITEQITVNNTSGSVLNYHFYQYSDFNMGGDGANDFVLLSRNGFTFRFNQVDQADGANIVEVVATPNANHGEADVVPNTINKLNDPFPTILDDSKTNAFGDVAWALEWDVNIGVGSSYIISKDKHLDVVFTPEPGFLALIPLGLGLCAYYRRRRQRG